MFWFVETGWIAHVEENRDDAPRSESDWNVDGTVHSQVTNDSKGNLVERRSPPWLWGVTDQTEPSIPAWVKDDALWQAALDAQE